MKKTIKRLFSRAAATLVLTMLTTATAGAQTTESVSYIDEHGATQTVTATVLDGSEPSIYNGWYVVNSNISYTGINLRMGNTNLILKDNCTITVSNNNDTPMTLNGNLTIYGQSGGTGKLEVNTTKPSAINGNAYTFTINGGIVESKSTYGWGRALTCGSLVFNGGKLKLESSTGILGKSGTSQTVTLNWRNATDRIYISSFQNISSVTVGGAGGKYFVDGSGNSYVGTYTSDISGLAGKELQPATAYTLSLTDGVTTTTEPLFTNSDVDYYAGTITLGYSGTVPDNYLFGGYTVNGAAIDGNTFSISADATVDATFTPDPAHFSVNDDGTEYTIHTAGGWNVFCDALQDNATWNRFSGKTVKLGADIEVTRMAGSDSHDFCGTFDGDGKTLTFNYGTSEAPASVQNVAPFSYVSNTKADPSDADNSPATIKNLHVTGDIYTSAKYAAGIVGQHWGKLTIENCHSSVVIHSNVTNNDGNDGTHGGIEAVSNGVLNIEGCLFDGKLLTTATNSTTNCGGFVGWRAAETTTISSCLYAPANLADGETEVGPGVAGQHPSATFGRNVAAAKITNSYYTRTLGTEQGKQSRSIAAGDNITIDGISPVGSPVQNGTYSVSGITAYAKGITRGTTFYYGQDDDVSLTLGNTPPKGYTLSGYEASNGGSVSGDGNPYTLTMPNDNVTISALFTPIDLSKLTDIVLGKDEATDAYDVNGDKQVNILDITKLIDILINVSQ